MYIATVGKKDYRQTGLKYGHYFEEYIICTCKQAETGGREKIKKK